MVHPQAIVLRLCASYAELPREQCAIAGRCEERACAHCGRPVHYDPQATIAVLGTEVICCENEFCWGRYVTH